MRVLLASSALAIAAAAKSSLPFCWEYDQKLESPCNIQLLNTTNYELRQYASTNLEFFTVASIQTSDWNQATQAGFQANFNYIEGGNSASVKIPMTAPVLMRSGDKSGNAGGWRSSFYVPASIFANETSIPTSTSVGIEQFGASNGGIMIAVAEFGGFATLQDFTSYEAALRAALAADNIQVIQDDWEVAYAQYDSPFAIFNRHNEVWIHVNATIAA